MTEATPEELSWTQFGDGSLIVGYIGSVDNLVVADLGCGEGATAAALAAAGGRVHGVDRDAEAVAMARSLHSASNLAFVASDAASYLSLYLGRFDLVVSVFGAVDFALPSELLPAIGASLRPGGRLVASSRHPDWERACRRLRLAPGAERIRRNLFDEHGWHRELSAAGLQVTTLSELMIPSAVIGGYLSSQAAVADRVAAARELLERVPACTLIVAEKV